MKKKIKNWILKTTAGVMGMLFLLSICLYDSAGYIHTASVVGAFVSLAWLTVFAYANGVWGVEYDT